MRTCAHAHARTHRDPAVTPERKASSSSASTLRFLENRNIMWDSRIARERKTKRKQRSCQLLWNGSVWTGRGGLGRLRLKGETGSQARGNWDRDADRRPKSQPSATFESAQTQQTAG
ncbi:UNVERIFIED_CONTAM: hypothetical protein K2H54_011506 [Gekko kuhli]